VNGILRIFAAILVVTFWVSSSLETVADVLLLHNDNLIEGSIVRTDDDLAVTDERGNVRYIPETQVQFRAPRRLEIYRWKQRRIDRDDVRNHIRLAQWCLSNELPHEAADELLHLSSLDPDNPAIRAIGRRLTNYRSASEKQSQTILPVAYQKPVDQSPVAAIPRELPEEVMADFKRTVQPILVNRCGQLACHGSGATSDFQLSVLRSRVLGREMTTRNLTRVINQLDANQLNQSPLLKMARTAHGPMKDPAIGTHEFAMYQSLLAWARIVVNDAEENSIDAVLAADSASSSSETKSPLIRNSSRSRRSVANSAAPTAAARMLAEKVGAEEFGHDIEQFDDDSEFEQIILVDPSVSDEEAENEPDFDEATDDSHPESDRSESGDPFDPNIFNDIP